MRGKTVIVTGANSGIGKATAAELLRREARVIMACRSRERGETAAQDIRQQAGTTSGELLFRLLDLASLSSVRSFCEQINKVTSINNTQTFKHRHQNTQALKYQNNHVLTQQNTETHTLLHPNTQ